ncbi:hypothetical protein [Spirosoma radiotolerans]|uniref:Uncharacterized protein n=1 Tax=Spirosoma radiotolerans TaxID=1379870 RepID=A0A0E3ZZN2_9BACT|nr:hypothetical protein [Spirosoma radiotolerans]AKD57768.1 hypothetical protein SD10_25600 [Spirosoma radiotolerans]
MLNNLSTLFYRISSWKTLLLAIGLFVPFPAYFLKNLEASINAQAGQPIGPIDLLVGYNPTRINQMVAEYGPTGRAIYTQGELTIDVAFPFIYTFLFCILLTLLFRHRTYTSFRLVNLLPVSILVFDLLENSCIVYLLNSYPATSRVVTAFCSLLTNLKWTVTAIILGLIVYGLVKLAMRSGHQKLERN